MGTAGQVLESRRPYERGGLHLCGACACYSAAPVHCGCELLVGAFRPVTFSRPKQLLLFARGARKASAADLAATMGVSRPVMKGWLTGQDTMPLGRLWTLACVLDTTVPLLLGVMGGKVGSRPRIANRTGMRWRRR